LREILTPLQCSVGQTKDGLLAVGALLGLELIDSRCA